MQYGSLGYTGLNVSRLGFGAARFAGSSYDSTEREMIALLRSAYDAGVTFFDTAGMYAQGRSETLLGKAFPSSMTDVVISSKVGYTVSSKQRLLSRVKRLVVPGLKRLGVRPRRRQAFGPAAPAELPSDYSPRAIRSGLETSLRRLRRDAISVFLLHGLPPHDRLSESVGCLAELKHEGKILHYGASCESLEDAHACLAFEGIEIVQVSLSLLEPEAIPFIRKADQKSVAIVARQCYAGGWLAKPPEALKLAGDVAVEARIEQLRTIATRHGRALPELAFRFVYDFPGVDVTLVGVRKLGHLHDAVAFADRPALKDDEREELATVLPAHA
jgi:aryl-alcohol dehydrogenase-like predicted oxidoreductase